MAENEFIWGLYDPFEGVYVDVARTLEDAHLIEEVNQKLSGQYQYLVERPFLSENESWIKNEVNKRLTGELPRGILN